MPLPTMSVRAAPEHHAIIRQIAAELRRRPDLPDVLLNVLQSNTGGGASGDGSVRYLTQAVVALESRVAAVETALAKPVT